jgi:hypothetical protein
MGKTIHIGGASGFWGDSPVATPQLLAAGHLDYIVYDYLAEITMSIMARAYQADPMAGYATDFVTAVMKSHLTTIAAKGVKIISNAGGVNPEACGAAVQALIKDAGLNLKVAVVSGDNLLSQKEKYAANMREMFSGTEFPAQDKLASINAYLGAFPIAAALDAGADIVITGRSVDSAVTLGACIHEFGWSPDDWDALAGGSLAGHIIECGPQATGGNFTDWEQAGDLADIGYPIVEISDDGSFVCRKPDNTAGLVSVGTVAEQMLYEIGDPQAYMLPDVVCDFSGVTITQIGQDRVQVSGARGRQAPPSYKVCATYFEGFRGGVLLSFVGRAADRKAQHYADQIIARCRTAFRNANQADFTEVSTEVLGANSQYGEAVGGDHREVVLKLAVKHEDARGVGLMLKEATGLALATPPGLSIFAGARPKPSPVVRLYSFLLDKGEVDIAITLDGTPMTFAVPDFGQKTSDGPATMPTPTRPAAYDDADADLVELDLEDLAWGRSGDKGNKSNIGIIARDAAYLPYIWHSLSEAVIRARFGHFLAAGSAIDIYYLPGAHAMNIVMHEALGGGGVASLRNDPQGKAYAQILLDQKIAVPRSIAENL